MTTGSSDMMARYVTVAFLGRGSFGEVFEAFDQIDRKEVALKKIPLRGHEVSPSMIRECNIMRDTDHRNIVRAEHVFVHDGFLYIVMERLSMSLAYHIECFPDQYPAIAKPFLRDLLSALWYCHSRGIIHRDVKPANTLITPQRNCLKLADFGLARGFILDGDALSPEVMALEYRAPELLLGEIHYTTAVDMWAAGCLFAQMIKRQPFFAGDTEVLLLQDIISKLGAITEEAWPGVSTLPGWMDGFTQNARDMDLAEEFPDLDPLGADLLKRLLCLNPKERISAEDALKHMYLQHINEDHD